MEDELLGVKGNLPFFAAEVHHFGVDTRLLEKSEMMNVFRPKCGWTHQVGADKWYERKA